MTQEFNKQWLKKYSYPMDKFKNLLVLRSIKKKRTFLKLPFILIIKGISQGEFWKCFIRRKRLRYFHLEKYITVEDLECLDKQGTETVSLQE